jgi:hypothetical protein
MEDGMTASAKRFVIGMIVGLSFAMAGGAWAQGPVTGLSMTSSFSGEAKVTAIDQGTRMLTLTTADGRSATHKVSDAVRNLGQIKVGDTVVVSYEERTTFVLSSPGTKIPGDREITVAAGARKGQRPAGGVMRQEIGSYTVVSTDVQANTITLVEVAGGQVRTFNVNEPEGRAALPRVKRGDTLTINEKQLLIAAVVPKS